MSGFFKLFCDISVYYALIFYLAKAIMNIDFFAAGWFFLILMCALFGLLTESGRQEHPARRLVYAIPFFALLFRPSLLSALLWIPLWIWCIYSFESGAFDFTYADFRSLCSKECIIMFLCYLSLFFLPKWPEAIVSAAFYLAFALSGMVIMLRYLRQDKTGGGISLGLMGMMLGASGLCAFFHVFAFAGNLIRRTYLWLVSLLFKVVTPETFSFMDEIILPDAGDVETGGIPLPSEGNPDISNAVPIQEMSMFEKVLIVLLVTALAAVIVMILFHNMKGRKFYRRAENEDTVERIKPIRKSRMSLFAPNDPREAVRWYYAHYVHECVKKGLIIRDNATSKDVEEASSVFLDEQVRKDFRDLYIRVRYSSQPVSKQDVSMARSYWKQIRSAR